MNFLLTGASRIYGPGLFTETLDLSGLVDPVSSTVSVCEASPILSCDSETEETLTDSLLQYNTISIYLKSTAFLNY